jgi:hypothetical protein
LYTTNSFLSFNTTFFYLLFSHSLSIMKSFFALSLAVAVSAAPTAITPRTDAPFGIKKGLAYNNGALTGVLSTSGSATWAYNWGTSSSAPKFQCVEPCYHFRNYMRAENFQELSFSFSETLFAITS